jgi:hypothetical protein
MTSRSLARRLERLAEDERKVWEMIIVDSMAREHLPESGLKCPARTHARRISLADSRNSKRCLPMTLAWCPDQKDGC